MLTAGAGGVITMANRQADQLVGYPRTAQVGQSVGTPVPDALGPGLAPRTLKTVLLGQRPRQAGHRGARLQELLAQVKHLSSSGLDLADPLHPCSEELGERGAVSGRLCLELAQTDGPNVKV